MPTKDDIQTLEYAEVFRLLQNILDGNSVEYGLIQLYELSSVLLSIEAGCMKVSDKACSERIVDWRYLLRARNILCHRLYARNEVNQAIVKVLGADIIHLLEVELGLDVLGFEHRVREYVYGEDNVQ